MIPNPAKKTAAAAVDARRSPRRRRGRPRGHARRAAQPRPRHHRRDHQPRPARNWTHRSARPAASWKPPRPKRRPPRRKSRSASTTRTWCGWTPRPSSSPTPSGWPPTTPRPPSPAPSHGRYARADDEAYALIREALGASGDIIPGGGTLTIRLGPLSAPRRTRALAALCDQLNASPVRYPGTQLTLRYEVKNPA